MSNPGPRASFCPPLNFMWPNRASHVVVKIKNYTMTHFTKTPAVLAVFFFSTCWPGFQTDPDGVLLHPILLTWMPQAVAAGVGSQRVYGHKY